MLQARGNLFMQQKKWAEAIADSNNVIAARQDIARVYIGRGRAFVEMGLADAAINDLDRALAINVNEPTGFYWRGQAYRRKGDADRALDDFSRAIAQNKKDLGAYFARAQLYSTKGDYTRSLADVDASPRHAAPDHAAARRLPRVHAGHAGRKSRRRVRDKPAAPASGRGAGVSTGDRYAAGPSVAATASQALSQTSGAMPPPSVPMQPTVARAVALTTQAKYQRGRSCCWIRPWLLDPRDETALKLRHRRARQAQPARRDACRPRCPGQAQAERRRAVGRRAAWRLAGMKRIDAGMADAERALAMDPNNSARSMSAAASSGACRSSFTEAIADFDRAIELAAAEAGQCLYRARRHLCSPCSQYEKALPDFDQALALNRFDDRAARATRGLALIFRGSASGRDLPDVNAVLERDPANSAALFGRGLAMLASGQYDRAIVALNQITMAAGEDDTGMRLVRARAYLGKGDAAGARCRTSTRSSPPGPATRPR